MDFFDKAKAVHDNKYKYFNDYNNLKTKISIECLIHGIFYMTPSSHLNGHGCKECLFDEKYNKYLNNIKNIHKDYEYDKKSFLNLKKIKANCKIHGQFTTNYYKHIKGRGCEKCSRNAYNKVEYFEKVKEIHNNKYSYNEDSFIMMTSIIEIFCKDHGWFKQPAHTHLHTKCKKCHGNHKHTTEDFIVKANKIHNNLYDYSKTVYLTNIDKIIIICPKNHEFKQTPNQHIQGYGCNKCSNNVSKKETLWLNSLNIKEDYRNIKIKVNGLPRGKNVDAYIESTNTVYEFLGDYWHGNPNTCNLNDINKRAKKTFQELYDDTMNKIDLMKKHGYNVVYIWEDDFDKMQI